MNSFEEDFPSLMKKIKNTRYEFYAYLMEENGMDDSCSNAESLNNADYVTMEVVQKCCLDRERVLEAIQKRIKWLEVHVDVDKCIREEYQPSPMAQVITSDVKKLWNDAGSLAVAKCNERRQQMIVLKDVLNELGLDE
jgi:hypothetical protein